MDTAALLFVVIGIGAVAAALLPQLVDGKPMSLPIFFLCIGMLLGVLPFVPINADPVGNEDFLEHLTEVVVIISLMGAGLGLDRRVGLRSWQNTWRLLLVAMPLSILFVALLGWGILGLAPPAAILLGAVLSPTDPVLAGEVQVGEPASEPSDPNTAEDDVRFSLTSEAGLNDALAFPFVYLAILAADRGTEVDRWIVEWIAVDVVYRLTVGTLVGLLVGWLLGWLFFASEKQAFRLSEHREGFVALAATFLTYGAAELVHGYGFLAVFVTAVTIRSTERFHAYHGVLHRFVDQVERLLTVLVLLLVGMAISDGIMSNIGWRELLVAVLFLAVLRPLVGAVSHRRSRQQDGSRCHCSVRRPGSGIDLLRGIRFCDHLVRRRRGGRVRNSGIGDCRIRRCSRRSGRARDEAPGRAAGVNHCSTVAAHSAILFFPMKTSSRDMLGCVVGCRTPRCSRAAPWSTGGKFRLTPAGPSLRWEERK